MLKKDDYVDQSRDICPLNCNWKVYSGLKDWSVAIGPHYRPSLSSRTRINICPPAPPWQPLFSLTATTERSYSERTFSEFRVKDQTTNYNSAAITRSMSAPAERRKRTVYLTARCVHTHVFDSEACPLCALIAQWLAPCYEYFARRFDSDERQIYKFGPYYSIHTTRPADL